jgi:electron transfer flavoprotein beta subunit
MLDIVVCIKAVPDPAQANSIRIDPVTRTLTRGEVPLVMNLLDKHALEAALQIKEQHQARISLLSMGPPDAAKIVTEGLAMGADRGFLLCDRAFAGADAFATAHILSQAIAKIGSCDLVLCGMASSDGSTGCVGPMLAAFLGMPVVTRVEQIMESDGFRWTVKAGLENGYRIMRVHLPAVLTVVRKLNTPRALSFSGIVKARRKELNQWGVQELGVSETEVGLCGSPTSVSGMMTRSANRKIELISGTREERAEQLVRRLTEAGVL